MTVYNLTQDKWLFAQSNGHYSGVVLNGDSLEITVKSFDRLYYLVESYDLNRVEFVHYLTPYIKTYGEVYVYNEKKIKALDKQREMLAIRVKNPAPTNTIIGRLY